MPRKSVVRLTDRPDMTLDVYRGRKTTIQQQQQFVTGRPFLIFPGFVTKRLTLFCSNYSLLNCDHLVRWCGSRSLC